MLVGLFVEEHPPGGQARVVRPVVGLGSGVQGHDDVLAGGRLLAAPFVPPLPFYYGGLFSGGLLLVLGVPLEHRHGGLGAVQGLEVKELGPQRLLHLWILILAFSKKVFQ